MIETDRMILRRWRRQDRPAFALLNADAEVMTHFPKTLTRIESDALVARLTDRWAADGIGFAVAERRSDGAFLGMVGLAVVHFTTMDSPLDGAVEVGWRLAREHWGQGYATEAARAWLAYGFETMDLAEIIAFTAPANQRSQAVMRRLGMRHDPPRDFEHPALPPAHRLRRHLVYTIGRDDWRGGR